MASDRPSSRWWVAAALTLTLTAGAATSGCGGGGAPGDFPAFVDPGKPDGDSEWEPATCVGWDLCLASLAAVRYFEDDAFFFPVREDLGVINGIRNLRISDNCARSIALDQEQNLVCVPDGDEALAFVVGEFRDSGVTDDGDQYFIKFDFEAVGRAELFSHPEGYHYLRIQ